MTSRTRRRLMVCMVIGLLTLPAEALLFPVVLTPDAGVAAARWVGALSPDALDAAAANIENYPPHYRRAIMSELDPADRSAAWRGHFNKYLSTHPQLTVEQVAVIRDAIDVAAPGAFAPPMSDEVKARIGAVYSRAMKVFGPQAAGELFVTLGPKTLARTSALPLRQRIGDELRSWRTVNADAPGCNCNVEIDTCDLVPDPWLVCSELYTCKFDLRWPMCGPLWSWACTGWCKLTRMPPMEGSYQ
jgi:hypothetical protein